MSNVIDYLEKELNEADASDNATVKKQPCELKWYLIKKTDFKNFDKKSNSLVSEVGTTFKKPVLDENGNPLLDENGKEVNKTIHKTWSDIVVPYSKGGEVISIPNSRILKSGKGFYYSIGINVLNKNLKVVNQNGNEVNVSFDKILKAFENYDKFIKTSIDKFKEEQAAKNQEKENER